MFRGVIFNRDKLVSDGLEPARRCLEVGSGPPSAVLVYDPRFLDHVASPFHVERPDRLRSIVSHLERADLFTDVERAPPATPAELARVHNATYLEYGIYPGTGPAEDVGEGEGRGFTVNVPFAAGCGDASYLAAHDRVVEPIVEQFRPDVVLMSLGIDAHYRDPLTSLVLSSPGYVELVARSAALATRLCGNRLAVALEGGYHLDALGEVIAGVVGHFRGRSTCLALSV